MRKSITDYKYVILAVLIVAGISIAGWSFAFYYENATKDDVSQKEAQNDSQTANIKSLELDHSKLILLLVCTGLIGFLGVRRKGNPNRTLVKGKRPRLKLRINLLTQDNPKKRSCHPWKTGCVER